MPRFTFVFLSLALFSCAPAPRVPVDTDMLEATCDHLAALGCKEGLPLYDSSVPGPKGISNVSCADEYLKRANAGVCLNFKALSIVLSCADIKAAEQQGCE